MQITDVRVRRIEKEGKMRAIVSITIDNEFVIHDIKVIEGEKENREILEELITSQDVKELYEAFEQCLRGQEKTVIGLRYGLFGKKARTQREIADMLGISRSYVSRIEKKAVEKLRRGMECPG